MRFVLIGTKRSISTQIALPKGRFSADEYRTVRDVIGDIEDVDPVVDIEDDNNGIALMTKHGLGELVAFLRNCATLKNYIITKTTDIAVARFYVLKQG